MIGTSNVWQLLLACLMLTFFCASEAQSEAKKDLIENGKNFYAQNCAKCHPTDSVQGEGAPGLKDLYKRPKLPTTGRPVNDQHIMLQMNRPYGKMPSFATTPEEMKKAVIEYLRTL